MRTYEGAYHQALEQHPWQRLSQEDAMSIFICERTNAKLKYQMGINCFVVAGFVASTFFRQLYESIAAYSLVNTWQDFRIP